MKNEIEQQIFKKMKAKDFGESMCNETKLNVLRWTMQQLRLHSVSNCKRDETLELLGEIMTKVKEANEEVENGIYDPMLEVAKHILNSYKIERRQLIVANGLNMVSSRPPKSFGLKQMFNRLFTIFCVSHSKI